MPIQGMRRYVLFVGMMVMVFVMLACEGVGALPFIDSEEREEAVLTVYDGSLNNTSIAPRFNEADDQFSHITLDVSDDGLILDLFRDGQAPDIAIVPAYVLPNLTGLEGDVLYHFDEYEEIEQLTEQIDPVLLENVRRYGNNRLYALPYDRNVHGLLYNRALFDQFNVPYPEDGMTWEAVIELADYLTREDDGTTYYGLEPVSFAHSTRDAFTSQLSLSFVDAETEEADYSSERWVQFATLWRDINWLGSYDEQDTNCFDCAFVEGRAAMLLISSNLDYTSRHPDGMLHYLTDANVDVVAYPTHGEQSGIGPNELDHVLIVSAETEYPNQALQVISHLLSEDHQRINVVQGTASSLIAPQMVEHFGADIPGLDNKNMHAFFQNQSAFISEKSAKEIQVLEVFTNTRDINTIIHEQFEDDDISIARALHEFEYLMNAEVLPGLR